MRSQADTADLPEASRRIALVDAPSNLGLRPPEDGSVPGCYKAPGALRDRRLRERLGAEEAGVVVPPRYRAEWWPGYGVRNREAIAQYSVNLARRVGRLLDEGALPLVLGGDCSILIGNKLALADRGRFGLAFIDGHSDFRHLGNSEAVGAAAGEDLAIVTGRGVELAPSEPTRAISETKMRLSSGSDATTNTSENSKRSGSEVRARRTFAARVKGLPPKSSSG
jgi:arginase family enzyme